MPDLYQPGCMTRQAVSNTYRVGHASRAGLRLVPCHATMVSADRRMGHFLPTRWCCVNSTCVSDNFGRVGRFSVKPDRSLQGRG